jgi:signal transduction histidine kinase
VESEPGKGTSFTIVIPMDLSVRKTEDQSVKRK